MIHNKSKNQLLFIVLVVGFFVGILYENWMKSIILFDREYLEMFQVMEYKLQEYVIYIVKMRVLPLGAIVFLQNFRWRKICILLINGGCGFLFGRILAASIIEQGIKGIGLCVLLFFPHMLFYAFTYMIVMLQLYSERKRKWKKIQVAAITLLLALGIFCEVYVNPRILKRILRFV